MERVLAIRDQPGLCWNCLKVDDDTRKIEIPALGYGSGFDEISTEIHLCSECYKKTKKLWGLKIINEEPWGGEYEFEKEIFAFFNQLPPEGQQFVENEFEDGSCSHWMEPQDWMDYFINKCLPHDKAKEYGLWSLEEKAFYKERFPKCGNVANRVFYDGSVGSWCPFGASGDKDASADRNISGECYQCEHFKERTEPIRDIRDEDWYEYEIDARYHALHPEIT